MRTTLTLDDDVAALLHRAIRHTRRPLKEVVNDALRRGLESRGAPAPAPYRLVPHHGKKLLFSVDSVSEALSYAEGEEHR